MLLSRLTSGQPEIFASVQGEGASCGVPSVFIRLSACNLECHFCDTKYTWDWSKYDRRVETLELDPDVVVRGVMERAGAGIRNVVITGGEPLLQQRDLVGPARSLKAAGFRIEVETNGTLVPDDELSANVDQWNVSPKLSGSGNAAEVREIPEALFWFAGDARASFKFVVGDPSDVDEVLALAMRYSIPNDRVLLMPEGTDAETIVARSRLLASRCAETGMRLGTRLHVLLWGAERGR